jgi:hypothetical protein
MEAGQIRAVGYVDLDSLPRFWNPTGTRHIRLVRYIRHGVGYVRLGQIVTILEPDSGSDKSDTLDMSDLGSDISDQEPVPWLWNTMEISDLVGYIRPNRDGSEDKDFEGLSTLTFFYGSVVSLLIVWHA